MGFIDRTNTEANKTITEEQYLPTEAKKQPYSPSHCRHRDIEKVICLAPSYTEDNTWDTSRTSIHCAKSKMVLRHRIPTTAAATAAAAVVVVVVSAVILATSIVSTAAASPAMAATVATATKTDATYTRSATLAPPATSASATTATATTASIAMNIGNEVVTAYGDSQEPADHAVQANGIQHHQQQQQQRQLDARWHARKLPELSTIYHIPEPQWNYTTYDSTTCELRYELNDLVEDEQVRYTAYERDCLTPIPNIDAGYTIKNVVPSEPVGTGSGTREFSMHLVTPNSQIVLQANPNVFDNETLTFNICIRMSIHTPSSQFSHEANFIETKIQLTYDLDPKGFSVNTIDVIKPECKYLHDDVQHFSRTCCHCNVLIGRREACDD